MCVRLFSYFPSKIIEMTKKKLRFFTESYFGFEHEWRGFVFQVVESRDRNLEELSLRDRFLITKRVLSIKVKYCAAVRFKGSRSSTKDRLQSCRARCLIG